MTTIAPPYSLRADIQRRLSPFFALLDARFLPLLLLGAPQAYNVYLWLILSGASPLFAVLGAAGFESAYIGVIAWADTGTQGRQRGWMIAAAVVALLFSVAVAIYVHMPLQGWWSLLHAGFPLVACLYTVAIHSASAPSNGVEEPTERGAQETQAPSDGSTKPPCAYEGCAHEAYQCEHECGTWVCRTHKGSHNQWKCTHNPNSKGYQGALNGHTNAIKGEG
jgi:hypothetical protein